MLWPACCLPAPQQVTCSHAGRPSKPGIIAMHTPYWEFFLSIEDELALTARYVEFNDDHLKVYSIAFSRILLASASEVDVVAKEMCRIIGPQKAPKRITEYRPIILERFPCFTAMEIKVPRHSLAQRPWEAWTDR